MVDGRGISGDDCVHHGGGHAVGHHDAAGDGGRGHRRVAGRTQVTGRWEDFVEDRHNSQLVTGVLMITVGLIFLADRLDLVPGLDMSRLWPVVLIVMGASRFTVTGRNGRRGGGGAWLIFLGGIFLLETFDILPMSQSWPLFIVAGGLSMLFAHRGTARRPDGDQP